MKSYSRWIKGHIMVGVNTKIITSAEATITNSADAPYLPQLLKNTAEYFQIREVSADKAYSSKRNIEVVTAMGAKPFIHFKSYSHGKPGHHSRSAVWERTYHYFNLYKDEFMEHYHKRSNAETAFAMVKAKFGGNVRSKSPEAQVNEVLVKFLCHNICVLVQSMYELGLSPSFEPALPEALAPTPSRSSTCVTIGET